jgi:uroporphyrinogen-III synthase
MSGPEPSRRALAGIGVLVTRAAHQAEPLCARIREVGGIPIRFPTLAIAGPDSPDSATSLLTGIGSFDLVVFISTNAVARAFAMLKACGVPLPPGCRLAAVGKGTLRALQAERCRDVLVPETGSDSEALLDMPRMRRVDGERVLIVRGKGGRPLLGDTLRARGAQVSYAEVYRRVRPAADPAWLLECWARGKVAVVTTTSNETLDNLVNMLGAAGWELLLSTPLLVVSERMAGHARALGMTRILCAEGADEDSILRCLVAWAARAPRVS